LIGVNTFLPNKGQEDEVHDLELIRSTDEEKEDQIRHLRTFQDNHSGRCEHALRELEAVALERGNVFAQLMETVKASSLGQISAALYRVGGEYRRNM
jgi:methylmalonyl-CoA mutase